MVSRHVVVHGRVQGVTFRDSLRRRADGRGVAGWTANRADGTVEAVLEGEPAAVDAVVDWCRDGPRAARVERVEVDERSPEGLRGFDVR
jgi:acylphosphatase